MRPPCNYWWECSAYISEAERRNTHNEFWSQGYELRRVYARALIDDIPRSKHHW